MIDTIARFHAYWWQRPELGQAPFPVHRGYRSPSDHEDDVMRRRRDESERFFASAGAELPPDLKQLYAQTLPLLPQLYDRYLRPRLSSKRNVTLIHGDCYFGQFFCPKDPAGQVFLMDLESANTFLPALDLAFMFATFWTPQQRHENDREQCCLQRYHQQLTAHGIDFPFDDLLRDYRVALTMMIFYPIWDAVVGRSSRSYWWPKMKCLSSAFHDHHCASLFS